MSAAVLELDDLTYSYPDINPNDFQTLISAKEEFRELSAKRRDSIPKRGEFFPHQKLIHRYLHAYNRLFLIWKAGVGKTAGVGGFVEINRRHMIEGVVSYMNDYISATRTNIKRVVWLVKGKSVKIEVKKQLACVIAEEGQYDGESGQGSRMKDYYEVTTYGDFYKQINNHMKNADEFSQESLIKQYSGYVIIIDEVQNLRIDPDTLKSLETDDDRRNRVKLYNAFHQLFHDIKRSIVVFLSASPAVNTPNEIPLTMNLLLPLDNQMSIKDSSGKSIDYSQVPLNELRKYFEGYISFLTNQESEAIPEYSGVSFYEEYQNYLTSNGERYPVYNVHGKEYKSKLTLMFDPMHVFQFQNYLKYTGTMTEFRVQERQAALFIYPDGSTGSEGFNKYIMTDEATGDYKFRDDEHGQYLKRQVSTLPGLYQFSAKFARAAKRCIESEGVCFVFIDFVRGSGTVDFSLCLQQLQLANNKNKPMTRFNPRSNILQEFSGKSKNKCFNSKKNVIGLTESDGVNIPFTVARLTNVTSEQENILNVSNSDNNWNGQFIKVIIGSPLAREGLNLSHITVTDIMGPGWNEANTYQAVGRTLRATSHDVRLRKLKEIAVSEGKNPDNITIKVDIALHAAVGPTNPIDGYRMHEPTADLDIYRMSEIKNIQITKLIRKMKKLAFDCQIHKLRNTPSRAVDFSAECDYDICDFKCADPVPDKIDYSSYNVLYGQDKIDQIKVELELFFRYNSLTTYEKLFEKYSNYDSKFIIKAINQMIKDKYVLTNQYGQQVYIYVDMGSIYTRSGYPTNTVHTGMADSYYSQNLTGIYINDLETAMFKVDIDNQCQLLQAISKLVPDSPEFLEVFKQLNIESKVNLLERSMYQYYINGVENNIGIYIITQYNADNKIFILQEPKEKINKLSIAMSTRGEGIGRKANIDKSGKYILAEILKTPETPNNEYVYLHILYIQAKHTAGYTQNRKSIIRILKPSEHLGWRYVTEYEHPIYDNHIINTLEITDDKFKKFNHYGSYDRDIELFATGSKAPGKFKIYNNAHKIGINYDNVKNSELIAILWELKIPIPPEYIVNTQYLNKVNVIENIKNKLKMKAEELYQFTDDKLLYYYMLHNLTKYKVALPLFKYFVDNDLMKMI